MQRHDKWVPFAWITVPLSVRIQYEDERTQLVDALLAAGWTKAKANEAAGWRIDPKTGERMESAKWEQGMYLANKRPPEYDTDPQEAYYDG
jgi:hypothetical protein